MRNVELAELWSARFCLVSGYLCEARYKGNVAISTMTIPVSWRTNSTRHTSGLQLQAAQGARVVLFHFWWAYYYYKVVKQPSLRYITLSRASAASFITYCISSSQHICLRFGIFIKYCQWIQFRIILFLLLNIWSEDWLFLMMLDNLARRRNDYFDHFYYSRNLLYVILPIICLWYDLKDI